jgi:hypothetical protein
VKGGSAVLLMGIFPLLMHLKIDMIYGKMKQMVAKEILRNEI